MLRPIFITISFFILSFVNAQKALTVQQVDSIVAEINNSSLLEDYRRIDSFDISKETAKMPIYTYKKQKDTGQIAKIERAGNGTCDSKEVFYFVDNKLLKAVIKMTCQGTVEWKSEIYYQDDIVVEQIDKATPLHGPAFVQSAYQALKRVTELAASK